MGTSEAAAKPNFGAMAPLGMLALSAGAGIGLLAPISSAYMKAQGLPDDWVGGLSAGYFLGVALGGLGLTAHAVRLGLRVAIVGSALFAGLTAAAMITAETAPEFALLRLGSGLGVGVFTTLAQVALGHAAQGRNRGLLTALYGLLFGIGMAAGPAFGTPLYLRDPMAGFAAAGVTLSLGGLVYGLAAPRGSGLDFHTSNRWSWSSLASPMAVHTAFAYGMAEAVLFSMLPVYLAARNESLEQMGPALTAFVAGGIVFALPASHLGDRWSRPHVMAIFAWLGAIATGCFLLASGPIAGPLFAFLSGAGVGPLYPLALSEVGHRASSKEELAQATGWFNAAFSVGCIAGPFSASVLMRWAGAAWWLVPTQLCLVLVPMYLWGLRARPPLRHRVDYE